MSYMYPSGLVEKRKCKRRDSADLGNTENRPSLLAPKATLVATHSLHSSRITPAIIIIQRESRQYKADVLLECGVAIRQFLAYVERKDVQSPVPRVDGTL
jgi:hypothetical protein